MLLTWGAIVFGLSKAMMEQRRYGRKQKPLQVGKSHQSLLLPLNIIKFVLSYKNKIIVFEIIFVNFKEYVVVGILSQRVSFMFKPYKAQFICYA